MAEGKLTVGNVEILGIDDGAVDFPFPLTDLVPNAPAEAWAQYQERYPEVFSGPTTWRVHWGGYLIRSEGQIILVNTGVGSSTSNPGMVSTLNNGVDGNLLTELQTAGVTPGDVTTVFFTHLHPDHVGYNLSQEGNQPRATFSGARYVVHQADWDAFASQEVQDIFPFSFWNETLEVWPESHWPGFALREADVFKTYMDGGDACCNTQVLNDEVSGQTSRVAGEPGGSRPLNGRAASDQRSNCHTYTRPYTGSHEPPH